MDKNFDSIERGRGEIGDTQITIARAYYKNGERQKADGSTWHPVYDILHKLNSLAEIRGGGVGTPDLRREFGTDDAGLEFTQELIDAAKRKYKLKTDEEAIAKLKEGR